jgi:two-component system, LuxR family, sensor kinase FixL
VGRARSDSVFEVRVEDNGGGVAPRQLEKIFRPLTTTKRSGMGLGLSVTRTIVESHGGTLSVERSQLGGAAFVFGLMRERELEDA